MINGFQEVVCCAFLIHDDEEHQLVVEIDEQELRLEEFGKLLNHVCGLEHGNRSQKNEDGD